MFVLLLQLISDDGNEGGMQAAVVRKLVWESVLHHPHILPQCGLSSAGLVFPNFQADSPCAYSLVISPLCIRCPTGRADRWLTRIGQEPQSSQYLQLLELEDTLAAILHPCFADDGVEAQGDCVVVQF